MPPCRADLATDVEEGHLCTLRRLLQRTVRIGDLHSARLLGHEQTALGGESHGGGSGQALDEACLGKLF